MATMNGTILPGMRQPEAFDERGIFKMLLSTGIISENKYRIADYNRILADMCYMGLNPVRGGLFSVRFRS